MMPIYAHTKDGTIYESRNITETIIITIKIIILKDISQFHRRMFPLLKKLTFSRSVP